MVLDTKNSYVAHERMLRLFDSAHSRKAARSSAVARGRDSRAADNWYLERIAQIRQRHGEVRCLRPDAHADFFCGTENSMIFPR